MSDSNQFRFSVGNAHFSLRQIAVRSSASVWLLVFALGSANALAQTDSWLGNGPRRSVAARDSGSMMRLVRPLSRKVEKSVVQVYCGSRLVSLGTVVSQDGFLITKRSELTGDPVSVRLPSGQKVRARVSAVRRSNDLALLKIEPGNQSLGQDTNWGIEPARFAMKTPSIGAFMISAGRDGFTVGLGVLGVPPRSIGHQGLLGVAFYNNPTGPAIVHKVQPQSGAQDAGIQGNDQIIKINGQETYGSTAARNTLGGMFPGEIVRLTIKRGDDQLELDATMSDAVMVMESQNDAKVNGPRNLRLSGFDSVMQHDTVLAPNECGGPLLNTSGEVIGINIARAGRVVSYALPSSLVAAEILSMLEEARR